MPGMFRDWCRDKGSSLTSLDQLHSATQPAETGLSTSCSCVSWVYRAAWDRKVFNLKVIRIRKGHVRQAVKELMGALKAGSATH